MLHLIESLRASWQGGEVVGPRTLYFGPNLTRDQWFVVYTGDPDPLPPLNDTADFGIAAAASSEDGVVTAQRQPRLQGASGRQRRRRGSAPAPQAMQTFSLQLAGSGSAAQSFQAPPPASITPLPLIAAIGSPTSAQRDWNDVLQFGTDILARLAVGCCADCAD